MLGMRSPSLPCWPRELNLNSRSCIGNVGAPTNEGSSNASSEQHRLLMTRDRMNLASVLLFTTADSMLHCKLHGVYRIIQVRVRAQDLQKTIMQAIFDLETAPERYDWCAT